MHVHHIRHIAADPVTARAASRTSTAASPRDAAAMSASGPADVTAASDQLTKESTFLQLLVAQIQNQDPLNPTDSIQFVGQLVQYSQLEQLLGINQGVQKLAGGSSGTPPSTGTPPPSSGKGN